MGDDELELGILRAETGEHGQRVLQIEAGELVGVAGDIVVDAEFRRGAPLLEALLLRRHVAHAAERAGAELADADEPLLVRTGEIAVELLDGVVDVPLALAMHRVEAQLRLHGAGAELVGVLLADLGVSARVGAVEARQQNAHVHVVDLHVIQRFLGVVAGLDLLIEAGDLRPLRRNVLLAAVNVAVDHESSDLHCDCSFSSELKVDFFVRCFPD